jgi:thiol:disulfide interchange protein DsbC
MKKQFKLLAIPLIMSAQVASAYTLNSISADTTEYLETKLAVNKIISNDQESGSSNLEILDLTRIDDSSVYLLQINTKNQKHTVTYLKEINSLIIKENGRIITVDKQDQDISSRYLSSVIAPKLKAIPEVDFITFKAKEEKHVVYSFTDPDCGYCRKLHKDTYENNKNGITIKYLPFPRGGLSGSSYDKLVYSYCSKDREAALKEVKSVNKRFKVDKGIPLEEKVKCENIVKKYYNMGRELGVTGTPSLFTESGKAIGGYLPPKVLMQKLLGDK